MAQKNYEKMKKKNLRWLLTISVMILSLETMGQIPPFTYYEPYTPRQSQSTFYIRDYAAEARARMEANAAIARQQQYMNEIIKSETVTSLAYHISKNSFESIQITIDEKRNGNVDLTCIGVKKNDKWISVKTPVFDLQKIYNSCEENDREAKSNLLSMMEVARFCFFINDDLYLTGLKDD